MKHNKALTTNRKDEREENCKNQNEIKRKKITGKMANI